jgi:hypothetical protein
VSVILLQVCPPNNLVEFMALATVAVCVVKYSHTPFSILANAVLGEEITASVLWSELAEEAAALTPVATNRDKQATNTILTQRMMILDFVYFTALPPLGM